LILVTIAFLTSLIRVLSNNSIRYRPAKQAL
jgi:hypothetical protein